MRPILKQNYSQVLIRSVSYQWRACYCALNSARDSSRALKCLPDMSYVAGSLSAPAIVSSFARVSSENTAWLAGRVVPVIVILATLLSSSLWQTATAAEELRASPVLSFQTEGESQFRLTRSGEVQNESYGIERAQFRSALKALQQGDIEAFDVLRQSLSHYPLISYLDYSLLRHQFSEESDKASVAALNKFEKRYDDKHLTRLLTRHLQSTLLKQEQWKLFLGVSKSQLARDMSCAQARARKETGASVEWNEQLTELWVARDPLPELCRDVVLELEAKNLPGFKALWERIYRAVGAGREQEVKELAALLARKDKTRVIAWVDALSTPELLIKDSQLLEDDLLNRNILLDLMRRWARQDPPATVAHWLDIRGKYSFFDDERYELDRELALVGAWLRRPEAYSWLYNFEVREDDLEVMEWRIRSALYAGDWPSVLKSLLELPEQELAEDHWSYWHARALAATGDQTEADLVYQRVAKLPTYYGFLSADKLTLPYNINDQAIATNEDIMKKLRVDNKLIRAREYILAGVPWEGRRLWQEVVKTLDEDEIGNAAQLAAEWGLPDRAIATANQAGLKKALALRFPFAFTDHVAQASSRYGLDENFILAIIRRESAFIPDIKSPVGALGLMQLMPGTAKDVIRLQRQDGRWDLKGRDISLTDAAANIDMGSFYLNRVGQRFGNHPALAAASYNAGPHRTVSWLPEEGVVEADRWIDTIPFSETRRYVRAVLAYRTIFEWRRTRPLSVLDDGNTTEGSAVQRLSSRIPAVSFDADSNNKARASDDQAVAETGGE